MIILFSYLIVAVLSYGLIFNFWQKAYPNTAKEDYYKDMVFSVVSGLFWPILLILLWRDSIIKNIRPEFKFY